MNPRARSRDLAKQETRDALIRAGLTLFSEEGVDLPSLDAICARAGFTRGAFYVHFKDREDFLGAVVDQLLTDFVNAVISAGEPQGGLAGIIDRFLNLAKLGALPFSERQRLLLQLVSRGTQKDGPHSKPYRGLIEEAVQRLAAAASEGQREGKVRPMLAAHDTGVVLVAAAVGCILLLDAGFTPNFDHVRTLVDQLFFEQRPR
jgi:TetR/AcrR family transcriptional regulator, transcriptional repressor for nem operon